MAQKIIALFVLAGLLAPSWAAFPVKQYAYVFDSRAKFIKIDLQTFQIVDVGNLWWIGTFGLTKPMTDPAGNRFLGFALTSPVEKDHDLKRELLVIQPDSNGDLLRVARIKVRAHATPDVRGSEWIDFSGLVYHPDGSRIYVSWNEGESTRTAILDGKSYIELAQVPQNWATDRTCFSVGGAKIFVPLADEFLVASGLLPVFGPVIM